MTSRCLFCGEPGDPCDHGAGAALAARPDWTDAAYRAIQHLAAQPGRRFTSETVTDLVGLPTGEVGTNRNNAVGAVIHLAASDRIIRQVGTTPSRRRTSHGATLAVWTGAR